MKCTLLFFNFLLFSPFEGSCQLNIDYDCQLEVSEIIVNFKKMNVKKFKIEYKDQLYKKRPFKDKFFYEFSNDTTLEHIYKKTTSVYHLLEEKLIYIYDSLENILFEESKKDKLFTTKDSSGFQVSSTFLIKKNDTILISEYAVKKSDFEKIELFKYFSNSSWQIVKNIERVVSDSLIQTRNFILRQGQWILLFEKNETKNITKLTKIVTISKTNFLYSKGDEESENLFTELNTERKISYFYNKTGRIERVEIIQTDSNSNTTKSILIPIVKMKR